jgi:hypothetical protein
MGRVDQIMCDSCLVIEGERSQVPLKLGPALGDSTQIYCYITIVIVVTTTTTLPTATVSILMMMMMMMIIIIIIIIIIHFVSDISSLTERT